MNPLTFSANLTIIDSPLSAPAPSCENSKEEILKNIDAKRNMLMKKYNEHVKT